MTDPALSTDDRVLLLDLVGRYGHLVDVADYRGVSDLFEVDGVLVAPLPPDDLLPTRSIEGRAAIVEELRRLEHFGLTYHGLGGAVFDPVAPGVARGRVNCSAHHVVTAGRDAEDLVWHLRYDDLYALDTTGGWRFRRRAITIELIDTRPMKRANDRESRLRRDGSATTSG